MAEWFTPSNIMFVLGVVGIMFAVFSYFRDPQVAADKKDALLAQQVNWTAEATDRRFKDIQDSFQALLLQSNNHIHTVDTKVDQLGSAMIAMGKEVVKLTTIIDERIPAKNK